MNQPAEFTIEPPKRFVSVNWGELWWYRDLFLVFAWRDVSVRYKIGIPIPPGTAVAEPA